MTKRMVMVLREHQHLTGDDLSGTIDDVIERLQELKRSYNVPDSTLVLEWETEYGSYGDSDREQVNLYDRRLETDEEYAARTRLEKEQVHAMLQHKRAQLEALKKELGEG